MRVTLLGAAGGEVTGGEDGPRSALRKRIRERFGLTGEMPGYRETIEA